MVMSYTCSKLLHFPSTKNWWLNIYHFPPSDPKLHMLLPLLTALTSRDHVCFHVQMHTHTQKHPRIKAHEDKDLILFTALFSEHNTIHGTYQMIDKYILDAWKHKWMNEWCYCIFLLRTLGNVGVSEECYLHNR